MKKFINIFLTILILSFMCFSFGNFARAENNVETTSSNSSSAQILPTVNDTAPAENDWLSPINLTNICLIAIGIVLILLAIAIFTRLK